MNDKMYKMDKPVLCIICGVAGSGKTILGEEIAKNLMNGVLLSKDTIQNAFTSTERSGWLYEQVSGPACEILLNFADIQLAHGKIPIIDAPFSFNHQRKDKYKEWVSLFQKVTEKHNTRLAIIRCLPPNEEELKRRITLRNHPWDKWKLQNWNSFLTRDPLKFPIPHEDVYELITEKSPSELAGGILVQYLKAKEIFTNSK